jgi:hypothetical protein
MVLAEPDEIEPQLVEGGDLLERLGLDVVERVRTAGRAAEVVGDTEAEGRRHAGNLAPAAHYSLIP